MNLSDSLAAVPLGGARLGLEMEINSISRRGCGVESSKQPILIAVVGSEDSELVVWMLRLLLGTVLEVVMV